MVIIEQLLAAGADVSACDPEVKRLTKFESHASFGIVNNAYEAADQADAIVLVTEWNAYRELDLHRLKEGMKQAVFFDLRNVYAPEKLVKAGFNAYVLGRQLLKAPASQSL